MDYYCDDCDKTIEVKSKSKHLESLAHNEFQNCIQRKGANQNRDSLERDEIINEYITTQKKLIYILLQRFRSSC